MGVAGIISAGDPGEEMDWDYSGTVTQDSYGIHILPASPSAYEDDYPDANWIMEIPSYSQSVYTNLGPEYFEFFGGVEQGVSYPLTDSDIFWPYPFEYGETWNDAMSGTLNVQGMIINGTRQGQVALVVGRKSVKLSREIVTHGVALFV